jgi:hypothetical protein
LVNYFPPNLCYPESKHLHVIWDADGKLFRSCVYKDAGNVHWLNARARFIAEHLATWVVLSIYQGSAGSRSWGHVPAGQYGVVDLASDHGRLVLIDECYKAKATLWRAGTPFETEIPHDAFLLAFDTTYPKRYVAEWLGKKSVSPASSDPGAFWRAYLLGERMDQIGPLRAAYRARYADLAALDQLFIAV